MEPLFLRACRGETTERAPLWLMRQAGRYLPEYRQIRAGVSFLELCKTPKLAAEVTLQPIRRFGFDAAILFSDLLVPLEAMGLAVEFTDEGPRLPAPIRTPADLGRVARFDPAARTGFVMETIGMARRELGETPLIGFAGAPFTVATYAIEGKTSKSFAETKSFFYRHPDEARRLLATIGEATRDYLVVQLAAAAQGAHQRGAGPQQAGAEAQRADEPEIEQDGRPADVQVTHDGAHFAHRRRSRRRVMRLRANSSSRTRPRGAEPDGRLRDRPR